MQFRCARCHHAWEPSGDPPTACPNCKAEAGLEPVTGIPPAMRLFGLLLGGVLLLALSGGFLGLLVR
jgi:hypothetical protein